jgi:hypothetical protein
VAIIGCVMKALVVVEQLRAQPCLENSSMVLLRLAYDAVWADPQCAVSVLASRVCTAATQQGLIMAAPAGSFTYGQLQQVQQQVHRMQGMQRPVSNPRPPGPPRMCWRCGASGPMAGMCTAAVNPSNPYPFKPARG